MTIDDYYVWVVTDTDTGTPLAVSEDYHTACLIASCHPWYDASHVMASRVEYSPRLPINYGKAKSKQARQ